MARSKFKKNSEEKREAGGFAALPYTVTRSKSFGQLSAYAVKLLIELLSNFNGSNNGDLSAAYSDMHERGWNSKGTLARALKELIETGFIEISRQGGRHKCSLYALSFYAVDECDGKLEILSTRKPKSLWRKNEPIPNIATLQKLKQAKDDARLLNELMNRAKIAA